MEGGRAHKADLFVVSVEGVRPKLHVCERANAMLMLLCH